MQHIALTGGIASGKSYVADRLHSVHGFLLVDADVLARQAVEPHSPTLAKIVQTFGPTVRTETGELDRQALAAIVFTDPEQRLVLDSIVHPAIVALRRAFYEANQASLVPIIAVIPLLIEKQLVDDYDLVVTVSSSRVLQYQRLIEHRGMREQEANGRLDSQCTNADREAVADYIITNNGTLEELDRQVDNLAAQLIAGWASA